jgi:hypothetical protein
VGAEHDPVGLKMDFFFASFNRKMEIIFYIKGMGNKAIHSGTRQSALQIVWKSRMAN